MSPIREFVHDKLQVRVFESRKELGVEAAREVGRKIRELLAVKPKINMIFASAPSQNEFLAALLEDKGIEWRKINAFHLDEYIGLDKDAPQGFGNFLRDRLSGRVPCKTVFYINGNAPDIQAECMRYSGLLESHPLDIACLGIGENGHLAFNDPPVADFNDSKLVKTVKLEERCRLQQVNDGCFAGIDLVPVYAVTLTIPAIMAGKYIYCMVPGATKAEAVLKTVKGEISTDCPASILRRHESSMLFIDAGSAGAL